MALGQAFSVVAIMEAQVVNPFGSRTYTFTDYHKTANN